MELFNSNLAAMNAAKKHFGTDWKEHAFVEKLAVREWVVQHKPLIPRDNAWQSLIVATEGAFEFPTLASITDDELASNAENFKPQAAHHGEAAIKAFFASRPAAEPLSDAELEAMEKEAEATADQQQAHEHELPNGKIWITKSSVEKPVKRVWAIADEMIAADPTASRKSIQEECVRRGIASGTARTQYQAWSTARKSAALNQARADELSAQFNKAN